MICFRICENIGHTQRKAQLLRRGGIDLKFDFEEHRRKAVAEYQPKRPLFQAFAGAVRGILKEALRTENVQIASIEPRAKKV